jgi:hypothetical protein
MDAWRVGRNALVKVTIYVEGGGDGKYQHIQCRQGFRRLIEKSGFAGKMPFIFACSGRNAAFDDFKTAMRSKPPTDYPMLLVDSEDPIAGNVTSWNHLRMRDDWIPPASVSDDQAQLMVTCMETWLMADRSALREIFGASLQDTHCCQKLIWNNIVVNECKGLWSMPPTTVV